MKDRNPYFDFLRGIAIIMVVGIHTLPAGSGIMDSFRNISIVTLRQLLNCAVPIFLAVSGFFVAGKIESGNSSHKAFIKRQLKKIYIPALLFSLPWLAFSIYESTEDLGVKLLNYILCGYSIYYFIVLILQYYLLAPVLNKVNNSKGIIITSVVSAVSILLITYLLKIKSLTIPLLVYAGPFPTWIIFFFLGMYFFKHQYKGSLVMPITVTLCGLILSISEHCYWLNNGSAALGIKLSSFIYSAGIIWLLFSAKMQNVFYENKVTRIINYLGGISFGIYLLHIYVVIILNKCISFESWLVNWLCVIGITVVLIYCCKRLIPDLSSKYLGFK